MKRSACLSTRTHNSWDENTSKCLWNVPKHSCIPPQAGREVVLDGIEKESFDTYELQALQNQDKGWEMSYQLYLLQCPNCPNCVYVQNAGKWVWDLPSVTSSDGKVEGRLWIFFIRTLSEGCWEPLAQNLVLLLSKLEVHTQNSINPEIQVGFFFPLSDRLLQEI